MRARALLPALLAGVLALEAFIALVVFRGHPYSQDEYNYVFQAGIFAAGKLWLAVEPWKYAYATSYMVVDNGHLFSKYPPGFAALLSLGTRMGAQLFVNPLLSVCSVLLIYVTARARFGAQVALVTALLVATNSYFLGYGASYFAQPLSLCLSALALWLVMRYFDSGRLAGLAQAGAVAGLTFWVRPLDGFCLMLALGVATLSRAPMQMVRQAVAMALPFGLCVLGLFWFNWMLADCFCVASYPIWDREFKLEQPQATGVLSYLAATGAFYWHNMVDYMAPLFANKLLAYAGPGFIGLVALGVYAGVGRVGVFCMAHIFCMVALYNFHPSLGFSLYGARYWYPCMAGFAFLAAGGVQWLGARVRVKTGMALVGALVAVQLFQLAGDLESYARRFTLTFALHDRVMAQCEAPSIIVMHRPYGREEDWPHYLYPWDMKRNGDLQGPYYYVWDKQEQLIVSRLVPGASLCNYFYHKGDIAPVARFMPRLNWDVGGM